MLQRWNIKCSDKNFNGKMQKFPKTTKTISPTGYSGATSLPPIGDSFLYIELVSGNSGSGKVFCSFGRTHFIQFRNKNF